MKNKCLTLFLLLFVTLSFAQQNFDISTLRIGPFTLNMKDGEADKIAGRKIKIDDKNYTTDKVHYKGEIIEIYAYESIENYKTVQHIGNLSTKSSKFRTKSGLGVGSTKSQLIEAYKNFPSFCVMPGWTEDGKASKFESNFILTDNDAMTTLTFKMVNDTVTEVLVAWNEGGC